MSAARTFSPDTAEAIFSPYGEVICRHDSDGKNSRYQVRVRTGPFTLSAIWDGAEKTSRTAVVAYWRPGELPSVPNEEEETEVTVAAFLRALKAAKADDEDALVKALRGGKS